jgi:hypothetical protein
MCLFAFLLSSCKQESSGNQNSSATPNFQAGSCNIGKWSNSALPLNLKMSPEIDNEFTNADLVNNLNPIEQTAKVWNDAVSPTKTLFQLPFELSSGNGSTSLNTFRDGDLGVYKSSTWFSNISANALAITQFYGILRSDGSLGTYIDLTHADIILNYRDFGSRLKYNGNSFFDYDVPTILLHEMGHFLGLCHESNNSSIMAPYYSSTQRSLRTFDTNKIKALYVNNQNYGVSKMNTTNAITAPVGTEVKGVIELHADGICKHFINGKLTYQHTQDIQK